MEALLASFVVGIVSFWGGFIWRGILDKANAKIYMNDKYGKSDKKTQPEVNKLEQAKIFYRAVNTAIISPYEYQLMYRVLDLSLNEEQEFRLWVSEESKK